MASLLDGVFAFVLLDTANRKVCVGRDTFGVRPLFHVLTQDGFLGVCSEAKGKVPGASCGALTLCSDWPLLPLRRPDGAELLGGGQRRRGPLPSGPLPGLRVEAQRQSGVAPDGSVPPLHRGAGPRHLRQRPRAVCRYALACACASAATPPSLSLLDHVLVGLDEETVKANIRTLFENAVRKRLMAQRRIGCLLSGRGFSPRSFSRLCGAPADGVRTLLRWSGLQPGVCHPDEAGQRGEAAVPSPDLLHRLGRQPRPAGGAQGQFSFP